MQVYTLDQVYGLNEIPPSQCPTYIERSAHKEFAYCTTHEALHVVVYGASRQGKSWLIQRYCPPFVRVGCDASFTRETLFKSILRELGVRVGELTEGTSSQLSGAFEASANGQLRFPLVGQGSACASLAAEKSSAITKALTSKNIDLTDQNEVIETIQGVLEQRLIVLENFHYLSPETQRLFAASMKEFLYHGIRIIIVGVWKETTKLVSLATDLSNRIETIDIGDWTDEELLEIVRLGDRALNVKTDPKVASLLVSAAGNNVGIFKSLMKHFCRLSGVQSTREVTLNLDSLSHAQQAIEKNHQEVVVPTLDRVRKLATQKKAGAKGQRYYIVRALLDIMADSDPGQLLQGIPFNSIVAKIKSYGEEEFQTSNTKQELLALHQREETISIGEGGNPNFIPLFYYDQGKDRVFIVESALLAAKRSEKVDLTAVLGAKEDYVR